MMNLMVRAALAVMVLLLASCFHRPVPPAVAACSMSCAQRAQACSKVCHNNCKRCTVKGCQSARSHFVKYRHGICVQGGTITRHINSFRDPLQCRKITCNCRADYSVCMQSCRGGISKRLQAPPIC